MKSIQNKIAAIKTNGYDLNFGNVLEHAFENYKKIALYAGLMLLVFSVLFGIVLVAIVVSFFDMELIMENIRQGSFNPEDISMDFLLIYTGSVLLITILISPFQAGFLKMADCGEKGEEFHVSTIFEYYKAPYLTRILFSTLLVTLMGSGLSFLLDYTGIKFVGSLIAVTLSFLTFLSIPLIVFGNLKAIDSLKSSIAIVSKQPLVLLGLLIVAGIASMVGFIGCLIGIFFTIPFIYSMNYAIYSAIIGFDSNGELEEIEPSEY